jgi:hypothetical protein
LAGAKVRPAGLILFTIFVASKNNWQRRLKTAQTSRNTMPEPTMRSVAFLMLLFLSSPTWSEETTPSTDDEELSEVTVRATRVANEHPASSYATPATALRFDPLTELQSRGVAEGQSDVTVRGGLFENTGFKLGAVTIMDPQTGHYVAELPVDPALMSTPAIYKGIDSAVEGFNSAIATVSYAINRVQDGGSVSLAAGSDNLNFQSLRFGHTTSNPAGSEIGIAMSLAHSEGDGSVAFGDHEFSRANVQIQHVTDDAQTDLIVSYQDKFFGWPGAYTGFASLPETDDTQTTLLIANHRRESGSGWFEAGGFYRRLVDDYDFNRTDIESGTPGSFEHETKVLGAGFQGQQQVGRVSWRYGGQLTSDKLVRSTDLTNGFFTDRTYVTLSVVPSIESALSNGNTLVWRAGATVDYSDRDSNAVSPLLGITLSRTDERGSTDYSLFLGREKAKQLSASVERDSGDWQIRATVFSRRDDNLVDWTYATGAPFSRQANAVDIDVIGFEAFVVRSWEAIDIAVGYTALDKDADYGSAQVDASFYALNFAKHRATVAFVYRFAEDFEFRLDNEYRSQEANPLRVGDDSTYLASASLRWSSRGRFSAALVVDNATDSEYQPFPGTPASGRQLSLSATYAW